MLTTTNVLDVRRAGAAKRAYRVAAVVAASCIPIALILTPPNGVLVVECMIPIFFFCASYWVEPHRYRTANRVMLVITQAAVTIFAIGSPHLAMVVMVMAPAVHTIYIEPSRPWRIGLVGWSILIAVWVTVQELGGTALWLTDAQSDLNMIAHSVLSALLTVGLIHINRSFNAELFEETRQLADELSARVEAQREATVALSAKRQILEEARASSAQSLVSETRHQHRLAAAQEQLKQFTYAAGHDLKEPIRTIRSFVELTRNKLPARLATDVRLQEHLGFVSASAESMHAVLEKLLNYSRVGNTEVRVALQSVNDLWEGALKEAGARADMRSVSVVTEVPEGLCASLPFGPAKWLFAEVVSNALIFGDPERRQAISCVAEHVSGGRVRIRIADNGIGIDEAYTDQVFGLFKRLHAREVYPGSGLGLPLVRRTVEMVGGSVRLDSQLGVGTTIELILPGGVVSSVISEIGKAASRN